MTKKAKEQTKYVYSTVAEPLEATCTVGKLAKPKYIGLTVTADDKVLAKPKAKQSSKPIPFGAEVTPEVLAEVCDQPLPKKKYPKIKKPEYNPDVLVVAPPWPITQTIPQITVDIKHYLKISKILNNIKADIEGIERKFKYMKYDDQQDALKYSRKATENLSAIRKILFPSEVFD